MALSIAKGLRHDHQLNSLFYSSEAMQGDLYTHYGFDTLTSSLTSLTEQIPNTVKTIVFHVNYATYRAHNNKKKAQDLVLQLQKTIQRHSLEMISIFHDIPTLKLPSLFITNPRHNFLTKQLAELSISSVTNNQFYERHLIENTNTSTICLNHFSRVGELKSNNLLGASRCNLVVLGGIEREKIYKKKSLLKQITENLKISQIVDIGQALNWSKINTEGLNIKKMGQLAKSDISDQLTISKVGIMDYSRYPGCLGKSSVFNAYKAHGVAPLLLKEMDSQSDNIIPGVNYFTPKNLQKLKSSRSIARMAHTNYSQYQTHSRTQWAQLIKELSAD